MTFTVETGAGVVGANSYISATDATTYLETYEAAATADVWPTDPDEQEAALLVGCQALELNYQELFMSTRVIPVANELSWPRYAFYDKSGVMVNSNTIPQGVKYAQALLALYHVQGVDLFPQQSKESGLTAESIKLGDLAISNSYGNASTSYTYDPFRKVSQTMWSVTNNTKASATQIVR